LKELGIESIKTRRSIGGGIIFEIPGDGTSDRAGIFIRELRSIIGERPDIRISYVTKKLDLNITGFIKQFDSEEIKNILSRDFKCNTELIRCGPVRFDREGRSSVRVKCLVPMAVRLLEDKEIAIGWSRARVFLINNDRL
jgi:hypothetical protein